MSNPTDLPTNPNVRVVPPTQAEIAAAEVTASRKERAKTLVKKTFTKVGVPVLIGAAAAVVVDRRRENRAEESESLEDTNPAE